MANVSGGAKLEAALNDIAKKLKRGAVVKVGFLSNAKYPNGTLVPLIAAINEFGAPSRGQPPRPFIRNMIADKKDGWPAVVEGLLKKTDYDVDRTLTLVGEGIAEQLRQAIVDFNGVPLRPATVARKGHDKQLVDSGHMLASVDFKIEGID